MVAYVLIANKAYSLYEMKNVRELTKIRNGKTVQATKIGKVCMCFYK